MTTATTTSTNASQSNTTTAPAIKSAQNTTARPPEIENLSPYVQFNQWRTKLDLFIRHYLRPAYERGLPGSDVINGLGEYDGNKFEDDNNPDFLVSGPSQTNVELAESNDTHRQ